MEEINTETKLTKEDLSNINAALDAAMRLHEEVKHLRTLITEYEEELSELRGQVGEKKIILN